MSWRDNLPQVRGRLLRDEPLGPFTWFRVGGAAEVLFLPADEADLSDFLAALPAEVPVTVLGVGSNVIVRDGGVEGVVIRLAGKAFAEISIDEEEGWVIADAGALDAMVAKAAAKAGLAGLEFYAGIPGTIGGALTMNAGCYGSETKDVLVSAWGFDRSGEIVSYSLEDFGYTYRHSTVPPGEVIWMQAVFQGRPDEPAAVEARMAEITARRETTQPIREKTGGSTFKNPQGHSSWKLVDEAGWRGKPFGGAMFSPLHANFMINTGEATAADLEGLGEAVRADVKAKTGIELDWEIKRIGRRTDRLLILVKHGAPRLEPGTPPSQWTLAPEGRDQAERIAGKLADFSPSAVVSSLEPKAIETAAVIAGAFGLVAELDAGLGEQRNDEGPFTDAVRFQAAVGQMFARPRDVVMGEESADEAHARFAGALERQLAAHPSQTLVAVTHGRVMTLWASRRLGLDPMPFWRALTLGAALVVAADAEWRVIEP